MIETYSAGVKLALTNEAHVRKALTKDERRALFALLDKVYAACFDPAEEDAP